MTVTGPDVSSNQPHPIDWHQVRAAGHTFAVVKATEGSGYSNPYFAQDVRGARAAGLVVWPYHWVGAGDGASQGNHAVSVIRQVFGPADLVWLDFEQAGVSHQILDDTRAAIERAGFKTGTYTYPDFWSRIGDPGCQMCGGRPLWWADYNPAHNRPAPAPWTQVALRQTDGTSVSVPGIGGLSDMSRGGQRGRTPHRQARRQQPGSEADAGAAHRSRPSRRGGRRVRCRDRLCRPFGAAARRAQP